MDNELEIQLETTSHLYKPLKYRVMRTHLGGSMHFVGASLSGLLIDHRQSSTVSDY